MNQDAMEKKYAWVRRLRMAVLEEQEAPVWRRADEVADVLEEKTELFVERSPHGLRGHRV